MVRKLADVSDAEMDVLQALWHDGPGTVREVGSRLEVGPGRRWAYTTVQTLLNRLEAKGWVESNKGGLAHVYAAAVTREGFLAHSLRALSERLCDGEALPLAAALVKGHRFKPEEIDRFRRLIDEYDRNRDTGNNKI